LRDLFLHHLQFLAETDVIKFDDLTPELDHKVAVIDWSDGASASQKNFLMVTIGLVHDPRVFKDDPFLKVLVEFRFPILMMLAKENELNISVSQNVLGYLYETLKEPLIIEKEEKKVQILLIPAGGKSDHKDLWLRIGNQQGGHCRCGCCDICDECWLYFKSVIDANSKGIIIQTS